MFKRCPIYNSTDACNIHSDCLFLRNGDCSVVLSVTIAKDNQKKLRDLEIQLDGVEYKLNSIIQAVNSISKAVNKK